ncbi:flagellar hook-length control protein FliK [Rhodoblastus sp.]|uniref:flagellar hook-length control protein FliK n=1 Tax=Rhodoblastus sp. TaxID=1962975 RepID=UPI00261FDDF5|nr:flagellar hook-length control protein FliK [Rhodoblastus sp.]
MSALGLITRNLAAGGASTAPRSGRDPVSDDGATPNFDATLAESARDATQPGVNFSAAGAGQEAADGAASPPTDAAAPALLGDGKNRLRSLLDLSGATESASPRDGAAPAFSARVAGGVKGVSAAKADDLARRLLDLSAAAKGAPGAADSTATGAGLAPAAAQTTRGDNAAQKTPAARTIPHSPRAAAAPEEDNHAVDKAPAANAPSPPILDTTLVAAMAQSANALGFATAPPASGARPLARIDAPAARSGTRAPTRAAPTLDVAARGGGPEAPAIAIETPAAPTTVHVVELKSWLPPAAPEAAAPSAGRTSTAPPKAENVTTDAAAGAAVATKDAAPVAAPAPAAPAPFLPSAPKPKPSIAGAGPAAAAPAPEPSAPARRRDLEITLVPKDLGGLAVRMKAAGDRLEIAFVADKCDTARLIDDKSAGLASQLRGAGLGLGGLDISVTAKSAVHLSAGLAANGGASFGAPQSGGNGQQGAAPPRSSALRQSTEDFKDDAGEKASAAGGSNGDDGLYL